MISELKTYVHFSTRWKSMSLQLPGNRSYLGTIKGSKTNRQQFGVISIASIILLSLTSVFLVTDAKFSSTHTTQSSMAVSEQIDSDRNHQNSSYHSSSSLFDYTDEQNRTILTIPLIPHSVQRRRHLELARRLEQINREAGYPVRKRPTFRKIKQEDNDEEFKSTVHRKEQDAQDQAQQVAALYQGYGTHYADLWCGTPPQRQTVIVDTGSGVTAFPCGECKDCGVPNYHIDPLFTEKDSSTFRSLTCADCLRGSCSSDKDICTIGQAYQEGSSWNAYEAVDTCYVGGLHDRPVKVLSKSNANDIDDLNPYHAAMFAFPMKFGCQTKLTGLFKTQLADGIMGMDVAPPSYWWQMYDAHKISHKSFSLCFSRKDSADPSGTEAGAMSFGGTDTRMHKTDMVYSVTDAGSTGFYVVHVKKVWLREPGAGESALPDTDKELKHVMLKLTEGEINGNRVIVDSGTTDTYFSRRFGVAFKEAWKEMTGKEYNHNPVEYLTKAELLANLPTILFQLNGSTELNKAVKEKAKTAVAGLSNDLDPDNPFDVILAIPPTHYFEWDDEEKKYVSRFYVDDNNGGVLGANAIMGHNVYFDVERGRIGWAESDCDHTTLVAKFEGDADEGANNQNDNNPDPAPTTEDTNKIDENNGNNNDSGNANDNSNTKIDNNDPLDIHSDNDAPNEGDEFVDKNAELDNTHFAPTGFCSGIGCQVLITLLVVFSVAFVAWKLVRKTGHGPNYDLTAVAELEMSSNAAHNYDDGDFVTGNGAITYRSNGSSSMNNSSNKMV